MTVGWKTHTVPLTETRKGKEGRKTGRREGRKVGSRIGGKEGKERKQERYKEGRRKRKAKGRRGGCAVRRWKKRKEGRREVKTEGRIMIDKKVRVHQQKLLSPTEPPAPERLSAVLGQSVEPQDQFLSVSGPKTSQSASAESRASVH